MAEAAANGDGGGGAAASTETVHENEPGDAENVPKAVETDPSRRYTRVGVAVAVQGSQVLVHACSCFASAAEADRGGFAARHHTHRGVYHTSHNGVLINLHVSSSLVMLMVAAPPPNNTKQYDVILGRGAFKTVFKAFDEAEGIEVAWNQVKVNDLANSPTERERLFKEIGVLKQLKHKNIMSFFDSWLDQKNLTINFITELFTSGTLRQ